MSLAKVYSDDIIIADEVKLANNFKTRFFGLMFRKNMAQNHGLLLEPCNSIHSFSMRFPFDAIFLSDDWKILSITHSMKPWKIGKSVKNSKSVLELCSQTANKFNLQVGDTLKIIR